MKRAFYVAAVLLAYAAGYATAVRTVDRYALTPTPIGALRVDRRTGEVQAFHVSGVPLNAPPANGP